MGELTGALGGDVWRLMPGPPSDWTMLGTADRRPWYPTMRVIGGERPGEWEPVLARAARDLAARVAARRGS